MNMRDYGSLEGLSGVIVKGKPEEIEILRCQLPVDVE
jgi:hypothetical protein